jgi:SAM-dependent methyltransferase
MPRYFDRSLLRYLVLPGSDIFTRRRTSLQRNWTSGSRKVLDAGFGNGWFSYRAYRSGATVTAVANQPDLIAKAKALYNGFLGIPESSLSFRQMNLYDIRGIDDRFDEIICYETLEHIRDDARVSKGFFEILEPGGVLHLCCPNATHPRWQAEELDRDETGGHVRYGYTEQSYRDLLEPLGFRLDRFEGVGGAGLVFVQEKLQASARRWLGEAGALIVALLAAPVFLLDPKRPRSPFSIYVRAVKPGEDFISPHTLNVEATK